MKNKTLSYAKGILLPSLWLSLLTGTATGAAIFLFKIVSTWVIGRSSEIYAAVRNDPIWLPLLLLGAAAIGLVISSILHYIPDARGGGIPTAISTLRGYSADIKSGGVPAVFFASLLTFFVGVPLGTEGPSVQMGTLIGRYVSKLFSKRNPAWERYVMTGGASAGFAAATGAPLTGILFAFEEAHLRFSPMIFIFASLATAFSTATVQILSRIAGISPNLFDFKINVSMPIEYIWSAAAVGVICGIYAVVFTKGYKGIRKFVNSVMNKIPFYLRIVLICMLVALSGFFLSELIGTGHSIVDSIMHGESVWYILLIALCLRAIFLIFANVTGITGGLFVPSLAFGAIIGALASAFMSYVGILPRQYGTVIVIVAIASFLSASSRTPLMALAFALEGLGAFSNALPIAVGVTLSFVIVEASGVVSFTDTVIERKIADYNGARERVSCDVDITVGKNAFVVGKEIRDILWPPSCVIVSVKNNPSARAEGGHGLAEGDVLHIHYTTSRKKETEKMLEDLLGER